MECLLHLCLRGSGVGSAVRLLPAVEGDVVTFILLPTLLCTNVPPALRDSTSREVAGSVVGHTCVAPGHVIAGCTKYGGGLVGSRRCLLRHKGNRSRVGEGGYYVVASARARGTSLLLSFNDRLRKKLGLIVNDSDHERPSLMEVHFKRSIKRTGDAASGAR